MPLSIPDVRSQETKHKFINRELNPPPPLSLKLELRTTSVVPCICFWLLQIEMPVSLALCTCCWHSPLLTGLFCFHEHPPNGNLVNTKKPPTLYQKNPRSGAKMVPPPPKCTRSPPRGGGIGTFWGFLGIWGGFGTFWGFFLYIPGGFLVHFRGVFWYIWGGFGIFWVFFGTFWGVYGTLRAVLRCN